MFPFASLSRMVNRHRASDMATTRVHTDRLITQTVLARRLVRDATAAPERVKSIAASVCQLAPPRGGAA